MSVELGAGAWSYFGDPRAIAHDGTCSLAGSRPPATSGSRTSGPTAFTKQLIYKGLGVDDHNNPSLVFRPDGRIAVFFSPHSGRFLPPPSLRPSRMRYRISQHPYSIDGFEPVRLVKTNVPGGLGYTYPEPDPAARQAVAVLARRRLEPDVLLHAQRPRLGARARAAASRTTRQRPYSKYVGDGNDEHPRHLHRGPRQQLPQQPLLPALREHGLLRRERPAARAACATSRCTISQARADLQVHQGEGQRLAARHRAHRPRPAARSSTRAASATATRSSTPTTTASAGSAARSSPPARASRPSPRAARRSTTRTRASSTSRAAPAPSTRSRRGSRPTTVAPGARAASPTSRATTASAR